MPKDLNEGAKNPPRSATWRNGPSDRGAELASPRSRFDRFAGQIRRPRNDRSFGSVANAKHAQQTRRVDFRRSFGDLERARNLLVRHSFGEQRQYFALPSCQLLYAHFGFY